jgi:hypothetical protein
MGNSDYLTEKEVEREYRLLRAKRLQAWRYLRRGGPRFVRIGRNIFYPRQAIEEFIRANLVDTDHESSR